MDVLETLHSFALLKKRLPVSLAHTADLNKGSGALTLEFFPFDKGVFATIVIDASGTISFTAKHGDDTVSTECHTATVEFCSTVERVIRRMRSIVDKEYERRV